MYRTISITLTAFSLTGCVALGFIDHDKFMSAIRNNRCNEAYSIVASSNFNNSGERWTYMGQVEYFCFKYRSEGVRLLTKGAEYGDSWAEQTLARIGEKIPDHVSGGRSGGLPATEINLRIIK